MKRLLYIEDESKLYNLMRDTFGDDFLLYFAENLAEADRQLMRNPIDYIISDIMLPDGSSLEFFKNFLKQKRALPPIIFLTGHGEVDHKIQGLLLGAADFFTKPTDPSVLKARIDILQREGK